jgi:hypothetical protein
MYNDSNEWTVSLEADVDDAARLRLRSADDQTTVVLNTDDNGAGQMLLAMAGQDGRRTVDIMAQEHTSPMQGAAVYLKNMDGDTTIELDADFGDQNKGRITTDELEITGGADLAEPFEVSGNEAIAAGALVIIDVSNPGHVKMSDRAYDKRVAGIISGAGGVTPGITLSQKGLMENGQNVALSGRAYALADASNGPIRAGDLLTTASSPGHAMKATDPQRSQGAIIGKAMTSLERGRGLVLVLVSLQ